MEPLDVDSLIIRLLGVVKGRLTAAVKPKEIERVCLEAKKTFAEQPSLVEINPPVVVCGDIHGQYSDLLRIFAHHGFPPACNYLFLGDYVDRGPQSLETILLLLCYKVKYPTQLFLLRGNHETEEINRVYGFHAEVLRRYNDKNTKLWHQFNISLLLELVVRGKGIRFEQGYLLKWTLLYMMFLAVFDNMPLCALISGRILCMHGGLSPELKSIEQLRQMKRPLNPQGGSLWFDLLWSDPNLFQPGWKPSRRGASFTFGQDVVLEACKTLNIDLIIRAHQVVQDGYEFFANRRLITIFSAPHYGSSCDNSAATATIDQNLEIKFWVFRPSTTMNRNRNELSTRSVRL